MSAFTKGRITGSRLALAIHLGVLATAAPVYAAQPPAGAAQPAVLMFDIPAQSLGSAVLAFADQAGLQVLFDSQRLQGLSSTALKGHFSVQEGLGRLLGGAPVEYRFTGERQVTLNRVATDHDNAITVGTTTITGGTHGQASDWVYQSPKSVAVISRDMIDKRPPRHAADMLEETAG
ncbi:MAG TPA: ligand-gated channel, partial [Pseudomonas sp.]|nr:ligand-gated channel [Pseudomonas sp.]